METLRNRLKEINTQIIGICREAEEGYTTDSDGKALEAQLDPLYTEMFEVENAMRELDPHCLPPVGSWADTARMMATNDDSGMDWDAWKDQMKEQDY